MDGNTSEKARDLLSDLKDYTFQMKRPSIFR